MDIKYADSEKHAEKLEKISIELASIEEELIEILEEKEMYRQAWQDNICHKDDNLEELCSAIDLLRIVIGKISR